MLRVGIEQAGNRTRVVGIVVRVALPFGKLRVRSLRGHPRGDALEIGKAPHQRAQRQRLRRERPGDPAPYPPQPPPQLEREHGAQRYPHHVERGQVEGAADVLEPEAPHEPAV